MQNRRSMPRQSFSCPVRFVVEDIAGEGTVTNLSEGGCAIASPVEVPEKGYAAAIIRAPGLSGPIVIELARIRWRTQQEFGLEFRIVTESARRMIHQALVMARAA